MRRGRGSGEGEGDQVKVTGRWMWSKYIIYMYDNVIIKPVILFNQYMLIKRHFMPWNNLSLIFQKPKVVILFLFCTVWSLTDNFLHFSEFQLLLAFNFTYKIQLLLDTAPSQCILEGPKHKKVALLLKRWHCSL
jgi:hypothetical protein